MHHKLDYRLAVGALLLLCLAFVASAAAPALADGGDGGHGVSSGGHGASGGSDASVAPVEMVYASYLDLTANIADLRARVDQWQKGDDGSLGVAQEKLERIEVVLGHVVWPKSLAPAISKARETVQPMGATLRAKDVTAAQATAKGFGDASHDIIHAFYGDWLPQTKGAKISPMAAHATYLDITANITDLRARVDQWQKGDEASLGVAQEKAERIAVLLQPMSSYQALAKPAQAIARSLPTVASALKARDANSAQAALKPLAEASHDLTHDLYTWLDTTNGLKDSACTQAAYLDLTTNITDLRTRITTWEKGDDGSLGIAQEKLARIEVILGHVIWPKSIAPAIYKAGVTLEPMAKALDAKDMAAAQAAARALGDASHDVTHAFYGSWLPSDASGSAHASAANGQTEAHGAGVVVLDTSSKALVLGGFGSLNLLVIAAAAFLKRTMAEEARLKAAHQAARTTKGSLS